MNFVIKFFKRDPFLSVLGLAMALLAIGFCISPRTFEQSPIVAQIMKEHKLADQKAKLMAISYYFPDFSYFSDIVANRAVPQAGLMDGYHDGKPYIFFTYYQKAAQLFPDNDVAFFLLAYCQYYRGNVVEAKSDYEAALKMNPYFFWTYYNLGRIYFEQGNFYQSAVVLSKALSMKNDMAMQIIFQNPFYRQIWRHLDNPPVVLMGNLNQGQCDAALLLTACFLKASAFDQALSLIHSGAASRGWHQELWAKLSQEVMNKQPLSDDLAAEIQQNMMVRLF